MWSKGHVTLQAGDGKITCHHAKFGDQRHAVSRDVMFLVCQVVLTWWRQQHLLDSPRFIKVLWMYLLAKFGDHRPYRNEDINSYINSYMDKFEKARLTDLFRHKAFYILCNNWKQASRYFIPPIQKKSPRDLSVKMLFWKWEPLASKDKVSKVADPRVETLLKPELHLAIFLWISQSILGHPHFWSSCEQLLTHFFLYDY